jgi:hypothetical protein
LARAGIFLAGAVQIDDYAAEDGVWKDEFDVVLACTACCWVAGFERGRWRCESGI